MRPPVVILINFFLLLNTFHAFSQGMNVQQRAYVQRNNEAAVAIHQNETAAGWQLIADVITRGDSSQKNISLIFSGHDFAEGLPLVAKTLKKLSAKGSFFFTGDFYRNKNNKAIITSLIAEGHYLGAHSDKHLLYADWNKRDSLLVSKELFKKDLLMNYMEMKKFGINFKSASYFLPPYEWYNDSIANWTKETGLQLINFTPGTLSNADYTWPELKNYRSSKTIYESIMKVANKKGAGLNGFILLIHPGTDPRRKDKFYKYLPQVIKTLLLKGYTFKRIDELLN